MFRKKSLLLLTVSCLVFTLAVVAPAFAGGVQRMLIPADVFFGGGYTNSCYNGGEGEEIINLTGFTQFIMHETNGGYVLHINGMGGHGTGETSGDTYQFNGGLQEVVVNGGDTWTTIHNVRIVSNNHDNSYQLNWRLHGYITSDGEMVVENPAVIETICAWGEVE